MTGLERRLWLSGADFLMAISLSLFHTIGPLVPVDGPAPPESVVDLWVLSIGITVAGVGITMLALSCHVATRVVDPVNA